jgi:hypothetical protein
MAESQLDQAVLFGLTDTDGRKTPIGAWSPTMILALLSTEHRSQPPSPKLVLPLRAKKLLFTATLNVPDAFL